MLRRSPIDHFMLLAVEQAQLAVGRTTPNPPVGAVIVRDGYAVAKGYTCPPGGAHAEINALANWDGERPQDCTLYVTLEPCCTHGRTPPCTDAIIASKIKRVVVGILDPSPRINGAGVKTLQEAGIDVKIGIQEEACNDLIRPFKKRLEKNLPFVAVKWAMTIDGKIATKSGDSKWISSEESRNYVHILRNTYDTIMVGTKTLLQDDPRLTTRINNGRDAVRIIIDNKLVGPACSTVYHLDSNAATWVFTTHEAMQEKEDLVRRLTSDLVEFIPVTRTGENRLDLHEVLQIICNRGLNSVLVEGGAETIASLLENDLVDRIYTFIAPRIIGGSEALTPVMGLGVDTVAEAIQLKPIETQSFGIDTLIVNDVISRHS